MKATLYKERRVANISWTTPIYNGELEYYAINVDNGLSMLTRNTSILYTIGNSGSNFFLRAINRCGQQGHMANITVESFPEDIPLLTVTYSGVMKGT